jgi:hypothetical protein
MSKIPGPPNPKKLLLHRERQHMTHISRVSSVREFPVFFLFSFIFLFEEFSLPCFLCCHLFFFSDDDEETPTLDVAARTSTSRTLVISEPQIEGEESSPPQQNVGVSTPPSSPFTKKGKGGDHPGAYPPIE